MPTWAVPKTQAGWAFIDAKDIHSVYFGEEWFYVDRCHWKFGGDSEPYLYVTVNGHAHPYLFAASAIKAIQLKADYHG